MPAGTPPEKVLAAVKNFAREEFGLKHRYAMALHTDEPHPHVHMVVKAVSEQGVRLHIRKATLREWRREFARRLRKQGVAANATERAVRGKTRKAKTDGIYRASQRGDSIHTRNRVEAVIRELSKGDRQFDPGKAKLLDTRKGVERGWRAMSEILDRQGQPALAAQVRQFTDRMPPPITDKEQLAAQVLDRTRDRHIKYEPISR
jgi:transketolase